MSPAPPRFAELVANAFSRDGLLHLVHALGFEGDCLELSSAFLADRGISDEHGVSSVCFLGERGTLTCYWLTLASGPEPHQAARVARRIRDYNIAQLQLFVFTEAAVEQIVLATFGVGDELRTLLLERDRVHASDIEAIEEMAPAGEVGVALALRHARALDRSRVTKRFFDDFRAQRLVVADAWTGLPAHLRREREQLALLLLSRLMFLYFLQRRGHLGEECDFTRRRLLEWSARARTGTFYRRVLRVLFFEVLNTKPARRTARARQLGSLPYLNGGLFEQHALERRFPQLDLPDAVVARVLGELLERYRFTTRETSDASLEGAVDAGVDPEMLGRVFEGLMEERTRATTGTFYTPAPVVDRLLRDVFVAHLSRYLPGPSTSSLVREARADVLAMNQCSVVSEILRNVRVLDPACGSGAFLLSALSQIQRMRCALEGNRTVETRHEIVAHSLYGVDLQDDAALLCALRLWLALLPDAPAEDVRPLPNLDRRIRQGDALIDPLDLRSAGPAREDLARAGALSPAVRKCLHELQPLAQRYMSAEPEEKPGLQRLLLRRERRLATAWINALCARLEYEALELRAAAQTRDLFGERPTSAQQASRALRVTEARQRELEKWQRALRDNGQHPFFSFGVHFADATLHGFDIVVCNPPWVRTHNWPAPVASIIRERFRVCHGAGQVDLALVFLERALALLTPGGTLGIVLPAKFIRSQSAGAARELLLSETEIISIEDHSLDQHSIFQADAFAALLVARKRDVAIGTSNGAQGSQPVSVTLVRRNTAPLNIRLATESLSLTHERSSPWLLVPPDVRQAFVQMSRGHAIGRIADLKVRRGVVTGANDVLVLTAAQPKLSGLAAVQAEGAQRAAPNEKRHFEAVIEGSVIYPLVRGSDLQPWSYRASCALIACETPPRRVARYLAAHAQRLAAPLTPPRLSALPPTPKLAWHDLASTLKAAVLPACTLYLGSERPLLTLNTVYFIAGDDELCHLLAAYFNSTPVRTFARAIAERAKDAHFRFFGWTMDMIPLPQQWRTFAGRELSDFSRQAHDAGSVGPAEQRELDTMVARAYSLGARERAAILAFDAWLRGDT